MSKQKLANEEYEIKGYWAKLDENKNVVEVSGPLDSGIAQSLENKRVGLEEIHGVTVSTVFLGINHGFEPGKNLWFETMIFGGKYDQHCERYETWQQAVDGHRNAIHLVKSDGKQFLIFHFKMLLKTVGVLFRRIVKQRK